MRSARFGTVADMARRDAVRNRELLVDAAATAFSEQGLAVSVNAIARDAGVNVATLYRHFPAKDALVAAVLEAILEPLAGARDAALEADAPLSTFLREALCQQDEHRGLVDALRQHALGTEVRQRLRVLALEIAEPVAALAHEHGELREDLDAEDVLVALRMVSAVGESARFLSKDIDRYVDVVLRGLSA